MVLGWLLTAVFAALALPCVRRLVRLDYPSRGVRNGDLADLLLLLAMVAMLSPVGGPIPMAGWQALLVLTAAWFGVAWWRGRGSAHPPCGHHAVSALAMLYMLSAMPGTGHGPWLTMSTMDLKAWPLVALAAGAYFVFDAARTGVVAVRTAPAPAGVGSRAFCRTVMGAGMGYLLFAAVV